MRLNIVDLSIVTTRTTEYRSSCFGRLLRRWLSPDHDLRRCRYVLMAYNANEYCLQGTRVSLLVIMQGRELLTMTSSPQVPHSDLLSTSWH